MNSLLEKNKQLAYQLEEHLKVENITLVKPEYDTLKTR